MMMQHTSVHTHYNHPTPQRDAFVATDRKFYLAAREQGHACGTTALAALVWGSTVYIANAGDSRAVLCRDGKPLQLTQDHRPSCQEELRRVEAHGGFVCPEDRVNGHLAVTRAIGDFSSEFKVFKDDVLVGPLTAEPDVITHHLTRGDEFLVLACDGLFDMFSSERVVELARDSLKHINDPQQCCKELVRCIFSYWGGMWKVWGIVWDVHGGWHLLCALMYCIHITYTHDSHLTCITRHTTRCHSQHHAMHHAEYHALRHTPYTPCKAPYTAPCKTTSMQNTTYVKSPIPICTNTNMHPYQRTD